VAWRRKGRTFRRAPPTDADGYWQTKRSMRVAFDSRPAGTPDGVGRYASCLLAELKCRVEVFEGHRPRGVDLYHTPWLEGAHLRTPCPMVLTLHTVAELKRPGERLRTAARRRLRYLAAQRAARVIVPSEGVARDVVEHLGVEAGRIAVIPHAAAPTIGRRDEREVAAVRARFGLPDRYLLWVGNLRTPSAHRQLQRLCLSPRKLPLVLAGPAGQWARNLPDAVVTGPLSDRDLACLYTGAQAVVLPGEQEGLALVGAEALSCATPVVACDVAAAREALGGRATYVPKEAFDELICAAEAARRPAPPPPPWSWADAAKATVAVYEEAVTDASRGLFPVVGPPAPPAVAPPPAPVGPQGQ